MGIHPRATQTAAKQYIISPAAKSGRDGFLFIILRLVCPHRSVEQTTAALLINPPPPEGIGRMLSRGLWDSVFFGTMSGFTANSGRHFVGEWASACIANAEYLDFIGKGLIFAPTCPHFRSGGGGGRGRPEEAQVSLEGTRESSRGSPLRVPCGP